MTVGRKRYRSLFQSENSSGREAEGSYDSVDRDKLNLKKINM